MNGTAMFTYRQDLGWRLFDFISAADQVERPKVTVIRDERNKPSLLMLTGKFHTPMLKGKFTKRPYRLLASSLKGK